MFVGNTHDPVTPLYQALKMSRRFRGAGLLELEVEGHCTLAAVSLCAVKRMQDYLVRGATPPPPKLDDGTLVSNGELSGEWDKCKPNEYPWRPWGWHPTDGVSISKAEGELAEAWRRIRGSLSDLADGGHPVVRRRLQLRDVYES